MVEVYLRAVSSQGAAVNTNITNAIANAPFQRCPDVVGNIDIDFSSWVKSLLKKMGFVKRSKISAKVSINDGFRKEIEYLLHHEIAAIVEGLYITHPSRHLHVQS